MKIFRTVIFSFLIFGSFIFPPARLFAGPIHSGDENYQIEMDYAGRTDGQPVYIGYGNRGIATTVPQWVLYKFTYDGNNQLTVRQSSTGAWSARASATYS